MEYFKVWRSMRGFFSAYTPEQVGNLFLAMMAYCFDGVDPELKAPECYIWPALKMQIDLATERASEISEARSIAGKLGGAPIGNRNASKTSKTSKTNKTSNDKDNDKEKDKDNEKIRERENRKRFTPPTMDEVRAYCSERNNSVDAQMFIDFYASKGWRVGNQPMKDWKAAVRTWEKRDNRPPQKKVSAQDYEQRDYSQKAHQEDMPDWLREGLEKMNIVEMKAKAE